MYRVILHIFAKKLNFIFLSVLVFVSVLLLNLTYLYENSDVSKSVANCKEAIEENVVGSGEVIQNTTDLKEAVVVIDAGHGGQDFGAFIEGIKEKDINLIIAKKLGDLLEQNSVKKIFTREKDRDVSLVSRARIANEANASLFISIHCNESDKNESLRGIETLFCPLKPGVMKVFDGQKFSLIVQSEIVKKLKNRDNGISMRPELAVLWRTKMPAALVEIGYLTNNKDRENLLDDNYRNKVAEGLYSSIIQAFKEMGVKKDDTGRWMEK